jgi:hypothetical protein
MSTSITVNMKENGPNGTAGQTTAPSLIEAGKKSTMSKPAPEKEMNLPKRLSNGEEKSNSNTATNANMGTGHTTATTQGTPRTSRRVSGLFASGKESQRGSFMMRGSFVLSSVTDSFMGKVNTVAQGIQQVVAREKSGPDYQSPRSAEDSEANLSISRIVQCQPAFGSGGNVVKGSDMNV